jgi:hypothetical protein
MLDLRDVKWLPNRFGGSESKWTMEYEGKLYMVKFPDPNRAPKHTALSYINNHYSEYIGCHIFQMLGIPSQNTFLGRGMPPNSKREKTVVACEVFCQDKPGCLIEFSKFFLHETDSEKRKKTTLEDVMKVIDEDVTIKNKAQVKNFFWDMFVVDALLGNGDRHLDNWGMIQSEDGSLSPAPVYDCGSTLSPLYSDEQKITLLEDAAGFKNTEFNLCSAYRYQGRRVHYHEFFKNPPEDLRQAIQRIVPRIKTAAAQIDNFIDRTEGLSDVSKAYMKKSLMMRRELILLPALKRCNEKGHALVRGGGR